MWYNHIINREFGGIIMSRVIFLDIDGVLNSNFGNGQVLLDVVQFEYYVNQDHQEPPIRQHHYANLSIKVHCAFAVRLRPDRLLFRQDCWNS